MTFLRQNPQTSTCASGYWPTTSKSQSMAFGQVESFFIFYHCENFAVFADKIFFVFKLYFIRGVFFENYIGAGDYLFAYIGPGGQYSAKLWLVFCRARNDNAKFRGFLLLLGFNQNIFSDRNYHNSLIFVSVPFSSSSR